MFFYSSWHSVPAERKAHPVTGPIVFKNMFFFLPK
jgi:hypothetical protein